MARADLIAYLELAKDLAKEAARKILNFAENRKVIIDLPYDVKVKADFEMEAFITKELAKQTKFPIISEENEQAIRLSAVTDFAWIVDPLDGSVNFSRDIPIGCISIALWNGMEPCLGVIYDFYRDEIFSGLVGEGAWLNDNQIKVSHVAEKSNAILCTGFPVGTSYSNQALQEFFHNIKSFKKIRLLGSAALSLAYVACGRVDYYHEKDIKIWDVAAGLSIVKAAGGDFRYNISKGGVSLHVSASNAYLLS